MHLTVYKYRLYPTHSQEKSMYQVLGVCRHWYNMCLEDRKLAWELEKRQVHKNDQAKTAILYRKAFPKARSVFSQTLVSVSDDLDKAFSAFYRRVKAKESPGYPRFKGVHHFHSFEFKQFGARLDGRRLKLYGVGRVSVRWHREIVGKIKRVRIVCKAGKWHACFTCEQPDTIPLPATGQQIGIDLGITALATDNTGRKIANPKWYRKSQRKLRIAQRALQRKHKGGKNRKKALVTVQHVYEHVINSRRDFINKLVYELIQNYDLIVLEDLKIKNMVRNPHLSKSILDAGWGYLKERLINKAVNAGRQAVFVNPAYTSKTCSRCGALFEGLTLRDRWVKCSCGLSLDRDHNAAINILNRVGQDVSVSVNVDALGHA